MSWFLELIRESFWFVAYASSHKRYRATMSKLALGLEKQPLEVEKALFYPSKT